MADRSAPTAILRSALPSMLLDRPKVISMSGISQGTAFPMFIVHHHADCPAGDFQIRCVLKNLPLPKGGYSVWTAMNGVRPPRPCIPWKPVISFDAFGPEATRPPEGVMAMTPIYVGADWRVD